MKTTIFNWLAASAFLALAVSCSSPDNQQTTDVSAENVAAAYRIDTVKVPAQLFKEICLQIENSEYLKISGGDEAFAKVVNETFEKKFNDFVQTTKSEHEGCVEVSEEDKDMASMLNIPGTVRSDFEILTNNPRLLSVIQTFVYMIGGGGNAFSVSAQTTNFDLESRKAISAADLGMSVEKLPLIKARIKSYFDNLFPDDKEINYPVVEEKDFDKLQFAVRNDSVMLVIDAYPTAHFSYSIYTIPISPLR